MPAFSAVVAAYVARSLEETRNILKLIVAPLVQARCRDPWLDFEMRENGFLSMFQMVRFVPEIFEDKSLNGELVCRLGRCGDPVLLGEAARLVCAYMHCHRKEMMA